MDHVGFDAFYRREHARVVGVVVALTGRTDLGRDAADEAFARALARWARVSKMASPGAWTARVALNVLRRSIRHAARDGSLHAGSLHAEQASPEGVPASDPELWALVRALPPRQRTAVVLRYVGDFTHAEIAHAMRVRPGTVGSTLDAAHRNLRDSSHDRGGRDPWMSSTRRRARACRHRRRQRSERSRARSGAGHRAQPSLACGGLHHERGDCRIHRRRHRRAPHNGLGIHTIGPARSSTTDVRPTVPTTTSPPAPRCQPVNRCRDGIRRHAITVGRRTGEPAVLEHTTDGGQSGTAAPIWDSRRGIADRRRCD